MSFMQNKNLGFDKEQVLMINRAFGLKEKEETFIEEVRSIRELYRQQLPTQGLATGMMYLVSSSSQRA
ncbi:MAG: hypothetical protein WDN75_18090 [Bacteroidota bacterium]